MPIVSEHAEDIVFTNPSPEIAAQLDKERAFTAMAADPHPLLKKIAVVEAHDAAPDEQEMQLLKKALRGVRQQAFAVLRAFDGAAAEAAALSREVEDLVKRNSRVYSDEPVTLWRPEDFRHVPILSDHDHSAKKKSTTKKQKSAKSSGGGDGNNANADVGQQPATKRRK